MNPDHIILTNAVVKYSFISCRMKKQLEVKLTKNTSWISLYLSFESLIQHTVERGLALQQFT